MSTSNLIQNLPEARASGPRGGVTSPPMDHHANSAFASHGVSPPPRWRWRSLARAVAVAVLAICGLMARADVVYEPLLRFGDLPGGFSAVAFTPDGRQVLSSFWRWIEPPGGGEVTYAPTVVLWDVQTGQQMRVFEGGREPVAVSPDGRWSLTGSETNAARLWNLQTGELLRTFIGHTNTLTAAAFSPDGQRVLTGSADGTAKLWDAQTGASIHSLAHAEGHPVPEWVAGLESVAFAPDGRMVATVGEYWVEETERTAARLWNAQTGQLLRTIENASGEVVFSSDSRLLYSTPLLWSGTGYPVGVWDVETGQLVRTLAAHTGARCPMGFILSPDERLILRRNYALHLSAEHPSCLIDAVADRVLRWFSGGPVANGNGRGGAVAFSPNGRQVVAGGCLWDIGVWVDWLAGGRLNQADVITQPVGTFGFGYGNLQSATVSADGTQFISVGSGGVYVRDIASAAVVRHFGQGLAGGSMALSPDGRRIGTGGTDYRGLRLWDAQSGEHLHNFGGCGHYVSSIAFSPDGKQVLTASHQDTARLWDAESGRELGTFRHGTNGVAAVAFSPEGLQILTGGSEPDTTAKLWDAQTGQLVRTFVGHTDRITSCAFSTDGTRIVTGSDDFTARIWSRETGESLRTLEVGQSNWVYTVTFSPDGTQVLTLNRGKASLWETESGPLLMSLSGDSGWFGWAGFLPDGQRLWTTEDFGGSVWDLASGRLLHAIHGYVSEQRRPHSAVLLPDRRHVVDDENGLWDIATGHLVRRFERIAIALSPDGQHVLDTVGEGYVVRLRSAFTGEVLRSFAGHTGYVHSGAFSPNGDRVLTASSDGTVKLWRTDTGQLLQSLAHQAAWAPFWGRGQRTVAFFPDGVRVVTAGAEVRVWDVNTGASCTPSRNCASMVTTANHALPLTSGMSLPGRTSGTRRPGRRCLHSPNRPGSSGISRCRQTVGRSGRRLRTPACLILRFTVAARNPASGNGWRERGAG